MSAAYVACMSALQVDNQRFRGLITAEQLRTWPGWTTRRWPPGPPPPSWSTASRTRTAAIAAVVFDLLHPRRHQPGRREPTTTGGSGLESARAGWRPVGGPARLRRSRRRGAGAAPQAQGLEGVLAKRHDAPYLPARRSPSWGEGQAPADAGGRGRRLVAGRRPPGGGVGSLLIGPPDEQGRLVYAGHVGTGFSHRALADLTATLRAAERRTSPFADEVPRAHAKDAHGWRRDWSARRRSRSGPGTAGSGSPRGAGCGPTRTLPTYAGRADGRQAPSSQRGQQPARPAQHSPDRKSSPARTASSADPPPRCPRRPRPASAPGTTRRQPRRRRCSPSSWSSYPRRNGRSSLARGDAMQLGQRVVAGAEVVDRERTPSARGASRALAVGGRSAAPLSVSSSSSRDGARPCGCRARATASARTGRTGRGRDVDVTRARPRRRQPAASRQARCSTQWSIARIRPSPRRSG